jgi:predicted CXXCH cytochrome family protein
MKHVWLLSLSLLIVLSLVGTSVAQIQTTRIIVKGVSPDLKALGRYDVVSTGLPSVGKGQKVWLEPLALYASGTNANDSWVDTILTETWTITGPPGSLITEPVHTDTTTYFIPDTTGQYLVNLSLTTSHGTKDTSIYINSALWVGVGNVSGPATNPATCGFGCHATKMNSWQNTGHAKVFAYNVDSSDHYSSSCVSCHTVGYDKLATAVNGGWDDVATLIGFTIPSPQHPGVWDSIKTNFPALANVSNIQCENCHGPGSLHMGAKDKNKMVVSYSSDNCGTCHGKMNNHSKSYEYNQTVHATSYGEPGAVEHMNSSNCAQCHVGQGFVREQIDGQTSAAPYKGALEVGCPTCHDPHDATNGSQLRVASMNDACNKCHKTRISSRGLHHSLQGPMIAGVNAIPFSITQTGTIIGNYGGVQFPGYKYVNSSHSNVSGTCVECHMAPIAGSDTLMIPGVPYSQYRSKLGGHTFRVMYDNETPDDLTDDILNPVGCKECHGTVTKEFVEQSQDKIKALLEQLRLLLPKSSSDSTVPATHTTSSLTAVQKAASYNWYFVSYDGSYGVHNYEYAAALLRSSIEMVTLGAGASTIASITDIPNDQGKQVQIVWNKFPAESWPTPVTNYMVLRQDSANSTLAAATINAASYRDMLNKVADGSRVLLAGSVWTKVGEYKAINLTKYSLVVPTLFDSTITGGQKLTSFEVVGYTSTSTVYTSSPMNGYSVDNLAPTAPQITAQSGASLVTLDMSTPTDADFKYFAVYRSTTPGFTPSGTPLATTADVQYIDGAVTVGQMYYYKVTAYDFAGNESGTSNEVNIMVTSVGNGNGIPTVFALRQNHPNPFNPSTTIQYDLPQAAQVTINIYNSLGALVTRLVDQQQSAGSYSIQWDGKDQSGNNVASGIYFYKMEAGSFTAMKKMLFIK